jgi:hypothetical protein
MPAIGRLTKVGFSQTVPGTSTTLFSWWDRAKTHGRSRTAGGLPGESKGTSVLPRETPVRFAKVHPSQFDAVNFYLK